MNYQQFRVFGKQAAAKPEQAKEHKESAKDNGQDMEHHIDENDCADKQHEETMTKPLVVPKIKISFDEEQTKKIGWEKGISSLIKSTKKPELKQRQTKKQAKAEQAQQPILQIPFNKRVQQIMAKKPLRQRLAGLLPGQLQLPISFDHQQLLKRMQLIDRTIEFLGNHRGIKTFYFESVRKNIFQTNTIVIELKMVQQLLFLDENCYQIEWGFNQKNRKFDIKINLPKIESFDLRKAQMRKRIVNYLILKQGEFIVQKKLTKVEQFKWHQQFDYKKVQIPQKSLPIHPNQSNADLRAFPDTQLQKIGNPALRSLLQKKKQTSQVKSLSSASVADMIFSRVPANQISNKLLQVIRQKQRIQNKIKQQTNYLANKVDKEALLKIYDEILMVFMSKNVSNIFKVTLVELLQQRLQIKNQVISEYVDKLIKMDNMDFVKVVLSSKKLEVVQIDKSKYKQFRERIQKNF